MDFIQKVNSESLYSLVKIEALAGSDSSFVNEIVDTFKIVIPNYLDQISKGLLSNDFSAIHRAAHQMKPTMDIFEIVSAMVLVREIEKDALQLNPNVLELERDLKKMEEIIGAVIQDLNLRFKKN